MYSIYPRLLPRWVLQILSDRDDRRIFLEGGGGGGGAEIFYFRIFARVYIFFGA